jgi:hypothetical protein
MRLLNRLLIGMKHWVTFGATAQREFSHLTGSFMRSFVNQSLLNLARELIPAITGMCFNLPLAAGKTALTRCQSHF